MINTCTLKPVVITCFISNHPKKHGVQIAHIMFLKLNLCYGQSFFLNCGFVDSYGRLVSPMKSSVSEPFRQILITNQNTPSIVQTTPSGQQVGEITYIRNRRDPGVGLLNASIGHFKIALYCGNVVNIPSSALRYQSSFFSFLNIKLTLVFT